MQNLIDFYNSSYKKKLNNYYIDLMGTRFLIVIKNGILYFIISLISSFLYIIGVKKYIFVVFVYNIILFVIFVFNIRIKFGKEYEKMNLKVIYDMIKFISNSNFIYKENFQIKEKVFKTMDIFNYDLLNYTGCNVIHIPYKNNFILLSDVNLYTYDNVVTSEIIDDRYLKKTVKKVKRNRFSGMYIELQLTKKNDCYIYLVPNNISDRYLNSFVVHKGDRVLLEDIIFNKRYVVYSSDQVKSRYILSIDLMDKINKVDDIIPNKKYIVFKDNQTVGIFINDYSFGSLKSVKIPIKRNDGIELEYVNSIYSKLNNIFMIYDTLDLNKDIYDLT